MTLIPKSIASDQTKYLKYTYPIQWVVLVIVLLLAIVQPLPFAIIIVILASGFYYKNTIYNTLAYEVVDTGIGLKIKNINSNDGVEVAYQDILGINYYYSAFLFKNNVVELTIKPHSLLGDTIRFMSWADSCNYNKEFTLNPYAKTPETQAWIDALKTKITQHTKEHDYERHLAKQ